MFWEAVEGGIGAWEQLLADAGAIRSVARRALQACHFGADGTDLRPSTADQPCAVACYECLASYTNQPYQRHLNRHAVRDFLRRLTQAAVSVGTAERGRQDHYEHLRSLADSSLEREFLDFLHEGGFRLPDAAQTRPAPDVYVQPDFIYERSGVPGICVFVDGPDHDTPEQATNDRMQREALEDRGFLVIAVRPGRFDETVAANPTLFGHRVPRV